MITERILEMIFCFAASWFYALIMNAPKKTLIHSSTIASLGYIIYIICVDSGNTKLGFLLGTAAITFLGEIYARKLKMPATIFIFPSVIPIVPGLGLYETMFEFVQNDIFSALQEHHQQWQLYRASLDLRYGRTRTSSLGQLLLLDLL